jgi:hypothetical protein
LAVRRLLDAHPSGYLLPIALFDPERFDAELVEMLARGADDESASLSSPDVELVNLVLASLGLSTARSQVAVSVSRRLVADAALGGRDDPAIIAKYCGELVLLAERLSQTGQMVEGVGVCRQALALAEHLVTVDADAHGWLLASVRSQMSMLAVVGADRSAADVREATEQAREAVRLAESSGNEVLLAGSLAVYARRLADIGDYA